MAGNLTRQTYPSGRVVETAYDAAGRISQVASGQTVYASSINYWPHGGVKDLKLGNNLWEHSIFNERLQPTEIGLGSTQGGVDKLRLNYNYGTSANNGNLVSQTIAIPGGPTLTQNYTYDELNRLKTAQESNGTSWKQTFLYDRYGNRTIDAANTTPGYVGPNPSIDSTRNRIAVGQGFNYDAAGNMISDNLGHNYGYDAENMQVNFDNGAARYYYDGNNKRVKSETNSGAVTTIFVYDAMGKLVAEYSTMSSGGSGTSYLTGDLLGSPRIITAANQAVKARHDYLPFGEEIGANVGGRTTGQGYVANNVRQKFTGKQRDGETGLDYFESRYYSSQLGRFTSADSFNGYATNPQSLNLYAYTQNNPLTLIDPTGHDPSPADDVDYYDDEYQEEVHDVEETEPQDQSQTLVVNINIIFEKGKYDDEQKQAFINSYVAQAKEGFAYFGIQFHVTTQEGTASNTGSSNHEITSGAVNGALNVFVTPDSVGPSTESTNYDKGIIWLSTGKGADARNLTHGLIHALGVASSVNGYPSSGYEKDDMTITLLAKGLWNWIKGGDAESATEKVQSYFKVMKLPHSAHPVIHGMPLSKTALAPDVSREKTVLREGAKRYLHK